MVLQELLENELRKTRGFTKQLLSTFRTPEEWTFQVHPQANHALWFAGHMGHSDNFFISLLDRSAVRDRPEFGERFGMGSQPTSEANQYPPVEEVLEYLDERREKLIELLRGMTEERLHAETPPGTPPFLPDYASFFRTAAWHETMHAGQLTVARKALGHPPIMGG